MKKHAAQCDSTLYSFALLQLVSSLIKNEEEVLVILQLGLRWVKASWKGIGRSEFQISLLQFFHREATFLA
jgi:flagellin-specific chaperone FliS